MQDVGVVFEETVRYSLNGDPVSRAEWLSMISPWSHQGYVRLGDEKRLYGVAIFHQLHCVDILGRALSNSSDADANQHHVHHCLEYLRQLFLCESDVTLEPGDFATRNYTSDPESHFRVCRDWSAVFATTERNYRDWKQWLVDSPP